ncbi:MAG: transposase, partial [Selenomonas sp.]|uniref:RNA-guided endonuclease InsQ/TnpB family protein n=1 Tax=Selenomonas sp. TaxID=2053611 RepID=UPI0025DE9BBA
RSFKSFFNLVKKAKAGEYRFQDIKIPHYREKGGMFLLVLSTNAINIKDGFLQVPMSRAFSRLHCGKTIKIPFPERLSGKKIKEVRILPVFKGQYFKIQYVYEHEQKNLGLDESNTLAIDIGLENLATCVTTIGTSFIMDGRKLKSINRYWNKRKAHLQSIADKQGMKSTKLIQRITTKRNNRAKDYIRKTARYIVNYCIEHNIGTIVCGYNGDFKRFINLGKVTNQQFTQISFGSLRERLANLCEQYGMRYIEQEESYTSKSSFLDMDKLPVYNPEQPYTGSFSGKRIRRGLYRFADGRTANADLNGAANILRKSKQNFDFEELCKGLLASPLRIRVA